MHNCFVCKSVSTCEIYCEWMIFELEGKHVMIQASQTVLTLMAHMNGWLSV